MTVSELRVKHRKLVMELDRLLTTSIETVFNEEARKLN